MFNISEIYWKDRNPSNLSLSSSQTVVNNIEWSDCYTIQIPIYVAFSTLLTSEGRQFIFKSSRGDVRIFIPAKFSCSVDQRMVRFNFIPPRCQAEIKTLLGAFHRVFFGITKGYKGKLKTVGVGYKGELYKDQLIRMVLGYSHPVYYPLYNTVGLRLSRKKNRLNLSGSNPSVINQTIADLYSFKQPDVYKGKGVRYRGFKLRKKEGKKKK
jgi:large subunit ribosomal protein L6